MHQKHDMRYICSFRTKSKRRSNSTLLLLALGSILERKTVLLTHSGNNGDHEVLAVIESSLDLLTKITIGNTDIVLGVTIVGHEVEETVVNVDELVLVTLDVGDVHVVGGRRNVFVLLRGEDVGSNKVHLGVTMLTGLGGRHVDDLRVVEGRERGG